MKNGNNICKYSGGSANFPAASVMGSSSGKSSLLSRLSGFILGGHVVEVIIPVIVVVVIICPV